MTQLMIVTAVVAVLVGGFGGFLWWGLPARNLAADLSEARAAADRLGQQLAESHAQSDRRFQTERRRAEVAERELRSEKGISAGLHMLVSQGKK